MTAIYRTPPQESTLQSETLKGVAYLRVSSSDQVAGTSLESQRSQIDAYAEMKGIRLVEVFSDNGVSGGKPLSQRPEGSRLVEVINEGEADHVIIAKLDRGFRSASDCLNVVESWEHQAITLHIVDLGGNSVDTRSPAGKFMLTVLAAAAEMERGMITERCNAGRRARKAEGKRVGEVPFGWTVGPDGKTLVESATEQDTIRLIRLLHENGYSLRAIAAELDRRAILAKKGGRWSHKQVTNILRSAA